MRTGSQRFYLDHLVIYYKPTQFPENACSRIGFSISKKLGNSVWRNRVRRHLREVFRMDPSKFSSFDILITINFKKLGKHPVLDENFLKSIREDLSYALSKIVSK